MQIDAEVFLVFDLQRLRRPLAVEHKDCLHILSDAALRFFFVLRRRMANEGRQDVNDAKVKFSRVGACKLQESGDTTQTNE